MKQVEVVSYKEEWPQTFEKLRDTVWPAVSDFAFSLEHVGSTAVPGLSAKPVIDLCIVIRSRSDASLGIDRLSRLGYVHRGDLGVPDREAFAHPENLPRHHLYMAPQGSLSLRNQLAVRDLLRANPDRAKAYGDLKHRLAQQFPNDIDGYVEGKTDFILEILRETGFSDEDLTVVEQINRVDNIVRPD